MSSEDLKNVSELPELPRIYNFSDWIYYFKLKPDNKSIMMHFKTLVVWLEESVVLPNRILWVNGVLKIISEHKPGLAEGLKEWLDTRLKSPKVTFEEYEHEMAIIADAAWNMCQDMAAELLAGGMSPEDAKERARKYGRDFLKSSMSEYSMNNPLTSSFGGE